MLKTNHAEYEERFDAVTVTPRDSRYPLRSPGDPVAGEVCPGRTSARAGTSRDQKKNPGQA
jgi:hypothetical protein